MVFDVPGDVSDLERSGLYINGWQLCSSSSSCLDLVNCSCKGSGVCSNPWFYHYMQLEDEAVEVDSYIVMSGEDPDDSDDSDDSEILELNLGGHPGAEFSHSAPGVFLGLDDLVIAEEVPLAKNVLSTSYNYLSRLRPRKSLDTTLLSLFNGVHKSVVFDIHVDVCIQRKGYPIGSEAGCITLELDEEKNQMIVLELPFETRIYIKDLLDTASLLPASDMSAQPFDTISSPVIRYPPGGPSALLSQESLAKAGDKSTAVATVTVFMSPVSMYNGSYPLHRNLHVVIHNVKPTRLCEPAM